ncbi:MAG: BREX system Lon protease-like protein BrxL [Verrucomicrobiales bacterium]
MTLTDKLNETFPGAVVRKDLLHRIKKGTNVPSFVLEFLLAKFCASDDDDEIRAGLEAVVETIQKNYVRPDESNKAQSLVQQKGRHKFIDKVHVNYVEKEKTHWAAMENFNSRRIQISEKFYRDNDRMLEGGIWAEATVGHNDSEEDDYAFFIEELRPIQLARFDFEEYCKGRENFTRDEWMTVILRSVGLEPAKMSRRLQFHFLSRLIPLVEANYNFVELGPRGTGKSYFFSEFTPYGTLISGGQTSTSVLFYNNQRHRVGIIGFWDVVAFDEVAGIQIKDPGTVQIMKDYMANGRFSRGTEVIASASLVFVGNIDDSIEQVVRSPKHDLFKPLPDAFDLAVIHRFHNYLPGWEIPPNSSDLLTEDYGFITDYMAEAFHHMFKHTNRYTHVKNRVKFGAAVVGRDETAVCKTVAGLLKLLHPGADPGDDEFEEYLAYALEGRRRVKEQLNKRKPDDEFAAIEFSYFDRDGIERFVDCPESRGVPEMQRPARGHLDGPTAPVLAPVVAATPAEATTTATETPPPGLTEKHFTIRYEATGHSYESIFGDYLTGATELVIEDPFLRTKHQLLNFQRFCELAIRVGSIRKIRVVTGSDDAPQERDADAWFENLAKDLVPYDIDLKHEFDANIHDREIRCDNGWTIKIGRGLDIYLKAEENFTGLGRNDFHLRPCRETKVDIFRAVHE